VDLAALGKFVLLCALGLAAFGVVLIAVGKGLVPHLPGDFSFKLGSVRVFFPLATSIVLSIVLTVVLNLFLRR
jgi:predicted cobalt transporter CbtA